MAITLGGYTLSDHLFLEGIENSPGIAWGGQRFLGGNSHVDIGPTLTGGRVLALQSENHLNQTDLDALKVMEAAGNELTLSTPRGTFTVIITSIEVEPDELLADPDDAELLWYSGKINLIEV